MKMSIFGLFWAFWAFFGGLKLEGGGSKMGIFGVFEPFWGYPQKGLKTAFYGLLGPSTCLLRPSTVLLQLFYSSSTSSTHLLRTFYTPSTRFYTSSTRFYD